MSVNRYFLKGIENNENDEEGDKVNTCTYKSPQVYLKKNCLGYTTKCPELVLFDENIANNTKNKIDIHSIDDMQNYVKYWSNVRFIIELNRIFASKKLI